MPELLHHGFGFICGQGAAHTWAPGGVCLPLCQRCTGLYAGAGVAALLHVAIRPIATRRWLRLHGGFLLGMIPFGFHWLPQGPVCRAMTGVVFGFGLIAFLRLTLPHASGGPAPRRAAAAHDPDWRYVAGLLATLVLVPWLGAHGDKLAAGTLAWLAVGGALALFGLVLGNVFFAGRGLARRIRTRASRAPV